MTGPRLSVFFYGSYMNFSVLEEVNFVPAHWEVARLSGFDIVIQPRANLVRSDQHCVYGIPGRGHACRIGSTLRARQGRPG